MSREADRQDFAAFLRQTGLSAEQVRDHSHHQSDQIPLPLGRWKLEVRPSEIEGQGVFATAPVAAGEVIAPARVSGKRTPAGRYTNHSPAPNARMVLRGDDVDLMALRSIEEGAEVTINYRQAARDLQTTPQPIMRERVEALERAIQAHPPVHCPIRHHFAPGVYAREMSVQAGVVLTGAVHKTTHLNILSKGRVMVTSDEGVIEMVAPCTLVASKGTKRAIHALEDSVWTTIHATTTTDLGALVEELTESTAAELQGGSSNPQQLAHEARMKLEV